MGLLALAFAVAGRPGETRGVEPEAPAEDAGLVYIIPVRGLIEPALLYVIRRGVAEAVRAEAEAIVFVMDTPGGRVDVVQQIIFTIQNLPLRTVTFVERNAISGGAMIALATNEIYMAPGSVIGDAMPIMVTPWGSVVEQPEAHEEKTVSAVASMIRAAAQQGGHDPDLAEAMVRRDNEYRVGGELISPAGQLLTLTDEEAARPLREDGRPLLSAGTVSDLDALLERLGLEGAERRTLQVTAAERLARYIAGLAPLFLMAGLLGLYIEVRTPGFGLPGILGLLALAVFFWGHHIAGLAGQEDIALFLVGVALLTVELVFLPDFGVVGVLGLICMLAGMLLSMTQRLPGGPWLPAWGDLHLPFVNLAIALAGTVAAGLLAGRFLPSTTLFRRLVLEQATLRDQGFSASPSDPSLVGMTGRALAPLRPSGPARFGERRLDVISQGAFLETGARVRIVEVHGNRVVVEPVAGEDAPS